MARFNLSHIVATKTENLAGGEAFQESPKLEFVSLLLTSFVNNQFYRSADNSINQLNALIASINDKKFVAKAAIFARNEFGMRSISHIVASEIASTVKGEKWLKSFFNHIIHRPDDMTEILAYHIAKSKNRPIPNALKKGFATAFSRFDQYQLSKYQCKNNLVSLVDVVNLVHPKPVEKNKIALKALINDELKSTDTWESKLTKAGQEAIDNDDKAKKKNQAWNELISNKKIGYFALLRNLRNIIEQAPDSVNNACNLLVDEKMIRKSLVLPFRYLTAIDEINKMDISRTIKQSVLRALNKALDIACSNIPKFDGQTLVALDCSGSMLGNPIKIGSIFAAVLAKSNNADILTFGISAKYPKFNTDDSTLTIAGMFDANMGGTDFDLIFNHARFKYDRIIILSDMQSWVGYYCPKMTFESYKEHFKCTPYIYSFDLAGYGTLQFPESKVYAIAGFSEKIFDIMKLLEQDKNALINRIESVKL